MQAHAHAHFRFQSAETGGDEIEREHKMALVVELQAKCHIKSFIVEPFGNHPFAIKVGKSESPVAIAHAQTQAASASHLQQ